MDCCGALFIIGNGGAVKGVFWGGVGAGGGTL